VTDNILRSWWLSHISQPLKRMWKFRGDRALGAADNERFPYSHQAGIAGNQFVYVSEKNMNFRHLVSISFAPPPFSTC